SPSSPERPAPPPARTAGRSTTAASARKRKRLFMTIFSLASWYRTIVIRTADYIRCQVISEHRLECGSWLSSLPPSFGEACFACRSLAIFAASCRKSRRKQACALQSTLLRFYQAVLFQPLQRNRFRPQPLTGPCKIERPDRLRIQFRSHL